MKILLGIFPDINSVETAINNLVEADFDEHKISLLYKDTIVTRKIINDYGPFKGLIFDTIINKYFTENNLYKEAEQIQDAYDKQRPVIAVSVNDQEVNAAKEILNDYHPEEIITVESVNQSDR